jgi:peptidoglycan hydrolase-like protein with peptidoglycan-binding domain
VPRYIFTKQLSYGMIDKDVVALQNALKYLGYFPSNVESTGHYLGLTANAVYKWQTEYKVAPKEELEQLKGRVFGDKSIIKMNELLK